MPGRGKFCLIINMVASADKCQPGVDEWHFWNNSFLGGEVIGKLHSG